MSSIADSPTKKLDALRNGDPLSGEDSLQRTSGGEHLVQELREQLVRAHQRIEAYEREQSYQEELFSHPDLVSSEKLVLLVGRKVVRELRADDDASLTDIHLTLIAQQTGLTPETVGKKLQRLDTVFHAVQYETKKRNTGKDRSGKPVFVTDTKLALLPLADQPYALSLPEGSPRQGGPREKKVCPKCGSENIQRTMHTGCLNCNHTLSHVEKMVNEPQQESGDVPVQMSMRENEVEGTCEVLDEKTPLNMVNKEEGEHTFSHQSVLSTGDPVTTRQQENVLLVAPLAEPDMSGPWCDEALVLYAEWHNGERYQGPLRKVQLHTSKWLHMQDPALTLAQVKLAYDDWAEWWEKHEKGPLHLSDLTVEMKNGVMRLYAGLAMSEAKEKKGKRTKPATLHSPRKQPQEDENEQVLWSDVQGAWRDPLEHFASFRYMTVAQARAYDYKPHRKLVLMEENNVLAKQRGQAAKERKEKEGGNDGC